MQHRKILPEGLSRICDLFWSGALIHGPCLRCSTELYCFGCNLLHSLGASSYEVVPVMTRGLTAIAIFAPLGWLIGSILESNVRHSVEWNFRAFVENSKKQQATATTNDPKLTTPRK
jgi:hypothetical protein